VNAGWALSTRGRARGKDSFSRIRRKGRAALSVVPPAVIASSLLLLRGGFSPAQPGEPSRELLARGESLYVSLCQRCHGSDGAATDYPGVIPLDGITRRLPSGEIARLSAPFVGRTFVGREAEALAAHLGTLRGKKGFAEPGYLFSTHLLKEKLADVAHYRIIDARPESVYDEGHIPNAVPWPAGGDEGRSHPGGVDRTIAALAEAGVSEDTFVVLYDEAGGLEAAALWWSLRRAGHTRAAILDGGWLAWRARGYPESRQRPAIEPAEVAVRPGASNRRVDFPVAAAAKILYLNREPADDELRFDWRRTMGPNGFLPAADLDRQLEGMGLVFPGRYRLEGPQNEVTLLVFLLHLTGKDPVYDPETQVLTIP
jgi:rhodanese-related sulfurtransferase